MPAWKLEALRHPNLYAFATERSPDALGGQVGGERTVKPSKGTKGA